MQIIKEFSKHNETGRFYMLIRTNTYTSQLQHFKDLAALAMAHFPGLTCRQIKIQQYGGRSFSGTFGIEWNSDQQPPKGYAEIAELPFTR